jgi:hypothetical protein
VPHPLILVGLSTTSWVQEHFLLILTGQSSFNRPTASATRVHTGLHCCQHYSYACHPYKTTC